MKIMKQKGFTLLELLVVMVIIGLLVGYVGPKYFAQVGKSEIKTARAQINSISKALDLYRLDVGHYPNQQSGLVGLMVAPSGELNWQGPYLQKALPLDPWGHSYQYKNPSERGDYELFSFGEDGKLGGVGNAADIYN